jgi:hypothetical protein
MSVYTAGIPAEYGRKIGGVVELNAARDTRTGLHGQVDLSGGNFDTGGASAQAQYAITDFSQFDEDTPAPFSFAGDRPDLDQPAFVQDLIRLDNG